MSALPYSEIPSAPVAYTPATVLSRTMDGLGFRYHWATEGLTPDALDYRPEPTCRSVRETLSHIRNLVDMIEDSIGGRVYVLPEPEHSDYVTTRRDTLEVIQRVSKALNAAEPGALEGWHIRFKMGEHDLEFPFWYSINGPIADAMYHLGQVVALRRAAGLPIPDGVNPFMGTRAEPPA